MESYEREYFLSKVMLGYSRLKIKKDLVLIVRPLTVEQNFFAQEAFKVAYDDALFSGVYTRKQMLKIMVEQGVWSPEQKKEYNVLDKNIENFKVKLYESFYVPELVRKITKEIRFLESEQSRLHEIRHANDHLDCEGIASYSRWSWFIENSTFCEDGSPYDFSDVDVSTILRYYNQNKIPQEKLRELGRTSPWRIIWSNSNKIPKDAFGIEVNNFTEEQSMLLEWTRLYDSIAESPDAPAERIIENDYALDGWLIKEKRKRDKDRNTERLDGLANKHQGADEVFIVARSKEEREQIYSLNSGQAEFNVKKRMDEISKSDKPIKLEKFTDVKLKAMNQANAKFGK